MMTKNLPEYDVAVIGGGAAGIYSAWRMLLEGPEYSPQLKQWMEARGYLKIAVFEGSNRIGGRVLSAKAPDLPDIVCEIGGMRYVSSQTLVKSLVENRLKLPRHEQDVTEPSNLAYIRGKRLQQKQLDDPSVLPYSFTEEERAWLDQGNTAANFLGYAVEKLFPQIKAQNLHGDQLREFLRNQVVDGEPLYQHGFWNLIAPVLSHEAYQIAITTVGYDCLGYNVNAVDAICEYFDFTPDVKYYLLNHGYDSMLWTIQEEFQQAGGEVHIGYWLESFDEAHLADGSTGVAMRFKDGSYTSTRAIVLAMPKRSLELLAQRGPVLDPAKAPHVRYLMNSVEPIHLYKMFIAYPEPWWGKVVSGANGQPVGRSLTDIPIRQCYYWGYQNEPDQKYGIIMAYNDVISADFWGGLRDIPLGPGDTKTVFSGNTKAQMDIEASFGDTSTANPWDKRLFRNWAKHTAPKGMIAEMHRQLKLMHGVQDAPEPIEAAFFDWADDPFGGAVHFWNPGYDSTQILHDMIQPVDTFPCYVCGEAYSTGQTWVEGAFQTAELVLRRFNIPQPKWINE